MIVIVYRGIAWISIDPSFTTQAAVLHSMRANDLVDAFTQAAKQSYGDKNHESYLAAVEALERLKKFPGIVRKFFGDSKIWCINASYS